MAAHTSSYNVCHRCAMHTNEMNAIKRIRKSRLIKIAANVQLKWNKMRIRNAWRNCAVFADLFSITSVVICTSQTCWTLCFCLAFYFFLFQLKKESNQPVIEKRIEYGAYKYAAETNAKHPQVINFRYAKWLPDEDPSSTARLPDRELKSNIISVHQINFIRSLASNAFIVGDKIGHKSGKEHARCDENVHSKCRSHNLYHLNNIPFKCNVWGYDFFRLVCQPGFSTIKAFK